MKPKHMKLSQGLVTLLNYPTTVQLNSSYLEFEDRILDLKLGVDCSRGV